VIHPRLSVNDASMLTWTFEQDLRFFAEAGICDVALLWRKLEAAGVERASAMVVDADLRVDNVMLGPVLELAQPGQWDEGRDRLRETLEGSRRIGADCVVITTGPAGQLTWEEAADAFAAAVSPVVEEARDKGMTIAVENTNGLRFDLGFVHTLRDTVALAERVGLGVCMEVNNVWGERALGETIARGAGCLRTVQVNDFVVGTVSTPDRAVPGDGDIPLARIIGQLLAAGYQGFFELEIVGPRIEAEGYASAVRRSLAHLSSVLESLGAR
jgi:sugar phosphate isomerase/epimerase